jgi:hypothetical protein
LLGEYGDGFMTDAETKHMHCPVIECPWLDPVSDDQVADDERARAHLQTHSMDEWVHAVKAWQGRAESLQLLLVVATEAAGAMERDLVAAEVRVEQAEARVRTPELTVRAGQKSQSNGDPSHPGTGSSQPTAAS